MVFSIFDVSCAADLRGRTAGDVVRFWYPAHNQLNMPLEFVQRCVLLLGVRDVSRRPLDPETILRRPLLRRGAVLFYGLDLELDQERRFYAEAIRGERLPPFQLGVYDPAEPDEMVDWLPRLFFPTADDWRLLRDVVREYKESEQEHSGLRLAAFPVAS